MTNGNGKEEDFVGDFERKSKGVPLIPDDKIVKRSLEEQVNYWHKLASSYNWTAAKIQEERDEIVALCVKKEQELVQLKKAREADQKMIHRQLETANKEKQDLLNENQKLYAEIKALKE